MGMIPPPPPCTEKEFYGHGGKDISLEKWNSSIKRGLQIKRIVLCVSIVLSIAVTISALITVQ